MTDKKQAEDKKKARKTARQKEPIGDVRQTDLSSEETYELAAGIEEQRDA